MKSIEKVIEEGLVPSNLVRTIRAVGNASTQATDERVVDVGATQGAPVSVRGFLRTKCVLRREKLPSPWPSATRSGSSSAWLARRCRPCSTSKEDIKVGVDMTASV